MVQGTSEDTDAPFAALPKDRRCEVMARLGVLRPTLEDDVPLARAAAEAGVPLRTAQRWLARYRHNGLIGLARCERADAERRRVPPDLVALVEGLALRCPRPTLAAIHRQAAEVARRQGWRIPGMSTVHAIARAHTCRRRSRP